VKLVDQFFILDLYGKTCIPKLHIKISISKIKVETPQITKQELDYNQSENKKENGGG
jgi:hypothetical protein